MPARRQFSGDRFADIRLELQAVAAVRECLAEKEAWAAQRAERILMVIEEAGQNHRQRLRLTVRSLRPIDQRRFSARKSEAWIERVERTLSRRDAVRMVGRQRERGAAILPENAGVADRHAAAPVEVGALQHACRAALAIDRAEEYGVAGAERRRPGKRAISVDRSRSRREPVQAQPLIDRLGDEIR